MKPDRGRWLEPMLAVLVLAGFGHAIWFLLTNEYLGPPFFYIANDTFMDWFNTAYWAHQQGAYDTWRTIYPPISFIFLRIFTNGQCYTGAEGNTSRDCDEYGLISLFGWYFAACLVATISLYRTDRKTALPRSIALIFGLPLLYGLERGNLVLPTFFFFVLAFGSLLKHARLRWLALAIAINFKVYLIAALFPQLLRRRWRWFEGGLFMTLAVYIASIVVVGSGFPGQILDNIVSSRDEYQAIGFLDQWYANTYVPLQSLLNTDFIPILALLGSDLLEGLAATTGALTRMAQLIVLLGAVAGWARPEAVSMHRLTTLGVGLALITAEANGYTQCILAFLVFQEKFRKPGPIVAIVLCYVLSVPFDFRIDHVIETIDESYIFGTSVIVDNVITLGPFLRPLLVMIVVVSLSLQTIHDVLQHVRRDDQTARRRFSQDLRIFG